MFTVFIFRSRGIIQVKIIKALILTNLNLNLW